MSNDSEFQKGGCGCHSLVSGAFKMEMPKYRLCKGKKDLECVRESLIHHLTLSQSPT